jgi:hypothetical protein
VRDKSGRTPNQAQRTVGLDKPCTQCGRPIYFNYQGPIEGVCGRCADRRRTGSRPARRTRTILVDRSGPGTKTGLLVILGILLGALAMYLVFPHLF